MKNLATIIILLIITTLATAQVSLKDNPFGDRSRVIAIANTAVDSTASVYSEWFTLNGWDAQSDRVLQTDDSTALASTYTPVPLYGTYKLGSAAAKPRITWIVQGSNDVDDASTYQTISTVCTADSVETLQSSAISITTPRAYYRFKITGTAGNRRDTYAKGEWYLPKKRQ